MGAALTRNWSCNPSMHYSSAETSYKQDMWISSIWCVSYYLSILTSISSRHQRSRRRPCGRISCSPTDLESRSHTIPHLTDKLKPRQPVFTIFTGQTLVLQTQASQASASDKSCPTYSRYRPRGGRTLLRKQSTGALVSAIAVFAGRLLYRRQRDVVFNGSVVIS